MKHYGIDVSAERRSTLPVWDIEYESKFIYSETTDTLYYGSDVGWVTVSGGGGGTSSHSALTELDYASANHTGFAPTSHFHTESNISDLDKYTQAEVDNLITTVSGKLDDHDELNNLDYASSGHTGFASTDNLTTVSGNLQTNIDVKSDIGHIHDSRYYTETELDNGQLDTRYYTESEIDTISGTLQIDIDTRAISGGLEHDGFSDFVGNEHIDHSGVTITAGTGLTGGGDITTNRTLDVDVGITNDKIVQIDDLDAAIGDYAKLTASGIEGRSTAEVLSDLDADNRYRDVYKTIYVDAAEMIPSTSDGALQGTKEYGTNDIDKDYLAFDGGATEERGQFTYSFPDNWDRLTIKAKFIWSSDTGSTTGDTVEWGIRAVSGGNDDTIDTAFGTPQVISDALLADNGTKRQMTAATSAITVAGTPAVGDEIQFEVYRNTDGTDDMVEDAWLFRVILQIKLSGAIVAY